MVKHIYHTKCDNCGKMLCVSVIMDDTPVTHPAVTLCYKCVGTINAMLNGTGIPAELLEEDKNGKNNGGK